MSRRGSRAGTAGDRAWCAAAAGIGLFLLFGSCGESGGAGSPEPEESSAGRTRDERLEADASVARHLAERIEAAGHDDLVLNDVENLLESVDENGWAQFPGWAFMRGSLAAYKRLNRPYRVGAETPFGIDFECEGHPVTFIGAYARRLRERGIELLVVPVPNRVQVYGDELPSLQQREGFSGAGAVYARLLLALAEAGVEVVNLLPAFLEERRDDTGTTDELLFFRINPHWTPRGVALAADLIAERVQEFDWFEPGEARRGEDFEVVHERGVHELAGPTPGQRESVEVWFRKILRKNGQPVEEKDRRSPILLIGDSFPGYYQPEASNLGRHLHARLGRGVDTISSFGFGGTTVWKAIQRRGDGLAGKRLVIWVFQFSLLAFPQGQFFDPFE